MSKLLVIDDEIEICEILKGFFSERGYEVIYSVTGQGGIDAISAMKPDIVMLDLCLEDMSGLDILKTIKERTPSPIVIIITGSASDDDERLAMKLGADYYIRKPFSIEKLRKLIMRIST